MEIACNTSFEAAVHLAKQRATSKSSDALSTLQEVVEFAMRNADRACAQLTPLLQVASTLKHSKSAFAIMILLGKQGGCNTAEMCDAMQAAIIMLGWDSVTRSATWDPLRSQLNGFVK